MYEDPGASYHRGPSKWNDDGSWKDGALWLVYSVNQEEICRNMEAERLKKEFGKDICFWGGGCDPESVLNKGTPAEVKEDVKRRLDIFMPGGGYVFNTVHNILPEVPPQNIVAMYEAVREFNR